jgi:hypothetical protein
MYFAIRSYTPTETRVVNAFMCCQSATAAACSGQLFNTDVCKESPYASPPPITSMTISNQESFTTPCCIEAVDATPLATKLSRLIKPPH